MIFGLSQAEFVIYACSVAVIGIVIFMIYLSRKKPENEQNIAALIAIIDKQGGIIDTLASSNSACQSQSSLTSNSEAKEVSEEKIIRADGRRFKWPDFPEFSSKQTMETQEISEQNRSSPSGHEKTDEKPKKEVKLEPENEETILAKIVKHLES